MSTETRKGIVVAVCMSPVHGYPTFPRDRVVVGPFGIEGDAHSGPMRASFRNPGTQKPNDRPISIVSDEVRRDLNNRLGLHMEPGDFNEQILVSGLGDLGDVIVGSHVFFGSGVELEVTDNAYPCERLEAHNGPGLVKALAENREGEVYSYRGIVARVVRTGQLQPGVSVIVTPA